LLFQIDYERVFSGLEDFARGAFESKLRPARRMIYKQVLLYIINGIKMTVNLFGDS